MYCDEYLLERLRILATDASTPSPVKKRVQNLFYGWSQDLQGQRGYERLAALYKQLPQRSRKSRPQPKYLSNDPQELEEDEESPSERSAGFSREPPRSRSNTASGSGNRSRSNTHEKPKKTKKKSEPTPMPRIDLAKEKPKIQQTLAESSSAATNLMNALQLINWETELSTENRKATEYFNKCRKLRKQVLRYIHGIESEEFIGSLIHANEELIQALQKYDKMSQAPDEDSDSDYERDDWKLESNMRKLNIDKGRRAEDDSDDDSGSDYDSDGYDRSNRKNKQTSRSRYQDDDDDDDNPFGDSNVIQTPVDEKNYFKY